MSILLSVLILTGFTTFSGFSENVQEINAKAEEAMGITSYQITISKGGSTANINVYTQASHTASQVGFKNGYIEKKVNGIWGEKVYLSTYYSTNTYYNSTTLGYTMSPGIIYRVVVWHYCIIDGVEYKQQQTSVEFSL